MVKFKLVITEDNEGEAYRFVKALQLCEMKKDIKKVNVTANTDKQGNILDYEFEVFI